MPDQPQQPIGSGDVTGPPYIGRPLRRLEDPPLIRGRGRYAADPAPQGLVHLAFRRALTPGGRGLSVDLTDARRMPGVVGAWKAGELRLADNFMPDTPPYTAPLRRPLLAGGEVRHEGDAVAVVAAESEYQAADAVELVEVDFEEQPADVSEIGIKKFSYGDIDTAFAGAPVQVRESLRMAAVCGAAIEPRAVLAEWDAGSGLLHIRATVGWVQGLRDTVAACLGLEKSQVIAITDDVGGSFGAKNSPYPEYVVAAAISRQLGRPVRWVASRSEDGMTTGQTHSVDLELELAAELDGRLRGVRGRARWPVGAYVGRGMVQEGNFATHVMSAYRLPAVAIDVGSRYSSGPPVVPIRGGSRPVGNFAIERMMDRLARRLGRDPIEIRRLNLVPASAMPFKSGFGELYDGGDYERLLDLAVERAGVAGVRARQAAGEPIGVGVALCVESTGIGMEEPSRVSIRADGTAEVVVGTTPQGQGHRTFVSQVAADRLGWPIERIRVRIADSRDIAMVAVTAGSRSALETGNSVALSAAAARRILLERAADQLEADAEDLIITPEGAGVRGVPGRRVPLADLVGSGLEAIDSWRPEGTHAWASSCHVATVRIDPETGSVRMLGYVLAHDSGRTINPLTLEGQLHGGYAHGLGYALFEEASYSPEGRLISSSFLDYTIVSAPELACEPELIHCDTGSSQNPEGFRGAGEAGTIAVPAAIANAIEDALHAAGHRDACVDTVPVTPERLWALVNSARR